MTTTKITEKPIAAIKDGAYALVVQPGDDGADSLRRVAADELTSVQVNTADADLDITDEDGNVLARFADGHIQTALFDSTTTPEISTTEADLDIMDESGNVLARFADGHIQTALFDSANVQVELPVNDTRHTGFHYIAHMGLFSDEIPGNTIAAFVNAMENGFSWLEIDVRPTSDNIYVLCHDTKPYLYQDGTKQQVSIADTTYLDLCGYTWDKAGQYKVDSWQQALVALKSYNATIICDLKAGNNADIVRIATMAGMRDRIMLSYSTAYYVYKDLEFVNSVPDIPLRFHINLYTYYNYFVKLRSQWGVRNLFYAGANASYESGINPGEEIPLAIVNNVPLLFAGATDDNAPVWAGVGAGAMAMTGVHEPVSYFSDVLEATMSTVAPITVDTESVTVTVGDTVTIGATDDANDMGGYIYGYSDDPTVASLSQTVFGNAATFEIKGYGAGSCTVSIFNPTGVTVNIPVTVEGEA